MDKTLIAYSSSFVIVLVVLYWKMNRQIADLLQAKQQKIQEAEKTAEYIYNMTIAALYEETKKNSKVQDDVEMIKLNGEQQIANLFKEYQDFQENSYKQLERELDEHIQQINGQFIQSLKDEFSELIVTRLQQRLVSHTKTKSEVEQFIEHMRGTQCG